MPADTALPEYTGFVFECRTLDIEFVERDTSISKGVACDVYKFENDTEKDLAIIRVEAGCKTPLQKVLKGTRTLERFLFGEGELRITRANGKLEIHKFKAGREIEIAIGDIVQLEASPKQALVFAEICFPPYEDGRFENLEVYWD